MTNTSRLIQQSLFGTVWLIALISGAIAQAQEPLAPQLKKSRSAADYQPRTLQEVVTQSLEAGSLGNKLETLVIYSNILPSRIQATYTGTTRSMPISKQKVLHQWSRVYASCLECYTSPYKTEALFTESGKAYWLAIRQQDIPKLQQTFQPCQRVELNVVRLGAAKTSEAWESMVLVESF